jgi:hypothetical protein
VNIGCNYNKSFVTDVVCRFKPVRGKLGRMILNATPVVPWTTVWVKMDSFRKNSANIWQQGKIHITQDMCRFYEEKNNLILVLLGAFKESIFDKIMKKCPYTVSGSFLNEIIQHQLYLINRLIPLIFLIFLYLKLQEPSALDTVIEREQVDSFLNFFPVIATGDFLMNVTVSGGEKGKNFIGNLFIVFHIKGNSMVTDW